MKMNMVRDQYWEVVVGEEHFRGKMFPHMVGFLFGWLLIQSAYMVHYS